MKSRKAFSKKDIVLMLVSILLVLMNVGAIHRAGRRRAKDMVCLSNLRQWGAIFEMYTNENNGYFQYNSLGENSKSRWPGFFRDYYVDIKIRLCPMAIIPAIGGGMTPYAAWGFDDGSYGSYGFNGWLSNRSITSGNDWGNIYSIEDTRMVPVFLDCIWYVVQPHDTDSPPENPNFTTVVGSEMRRVCLDRHNAAINGLFTDWSVRKIGLKELWTLKWHRNFDNTTGLWTKGGGVSPQDWPEWMTEFKDY